MQKNLRISMKGLISFPKVICFFLLMFAVMISWLQVHSQPLQAKTPKKKDPNLPLQRDKWFQKGRTSPDNLPAAVHRNQAKQQAQQLPLITANSVSSGTIKALVLGPS